MTGLGPTIAGSLAMAAISTAGDFVWATWIAEHRAVYGLIHGTVLFLSLGLVLATVGATHASPLPRAAQGAFGGAAIGGLGAGLYYVLSPFIGFSAMLLVWFAVWIALAALYGHLNAARMHHGNFHDVRSSTRAVASRGVIAATASALAFYSISGIWRPFNPQGLDFAVHFAAWTLAFLPGFAALMLARR